MRLLFVLFVVLSACGAKRSTGPAWPKMTEKEVDGGESLAPRPGASSVAAIEASADDNDDDDDEPAADATTDKSDDDDDEPSEAAAPDTASDREIIITTDEIVIEIEDEE